MITLITGKPGHGKTLNTIKEVRDRALKENRMVCYANIKELSPALGWFEMADPFQWFNAPVGSILVFDECQDFFSPFPSRGELPPHIAPFNKHRHSGFDIYLITQKPSLLASQVRELCENHIHYFRPFGWSKTNRVEWANAVLDPYKKSNYADAISKRKIALDTSIYGLYKSAEVHTVKPRYPFALFVPFLLILFLLPLLWYVYHHIRDPLPDDVKRKVAPQSKPESLPLAPSPFVLPEQNPAASGAASAAPAQALPVGAIKGEYSVGSRQTVYLVQDETGYHRVAATFCAVIDSELMCKHRGRAYYWGVKLKAHRDDSVPRLLSKN